MRATNEKLLERYIIVIARELGKALKGLHDAGILHRDVKGQSPSPVQRPKPKIPVLPVLTKNGADVSAPF